MLTPAIHPRRTTPRRASVTQTHEAYAFGAPLKGIDVSQPLPGGDPQTAIRLQNLICANSDGEVFDVTVALPVGTTPVPVLTVSVGPYLGEWTSLNYTTPAGVHYMLMVSPAGGYYAYDGATFTEIVAGAAALQIDGIDPMTFSYITVFKNRLVFIEHETTKVWYLPVGQIAGVATEFDFGAMLPNGGEVVMLVNWTYDGGGGTGSSTGLSNKLVIVADQGDVLVYGGEDPDDAATFRVEGRWYVGRVPIGNRFASQYMQDVAIISERGLCFLSELMRGEGFFGNTVVASNINSELAALVARTLDSKYWEIKLLPHEQLMVINVPDYNRENLQWAYEVNNKAFCTLKGLPMLTVDTFDGRSFCGDIDGNVWWCFEGQSDGAIGIVPGKDLQGTCVTAFSSLGEGIRVKRFLMCRASFISSTAPGVQIRLNKEWNLGLPSGAPAYLAAGANFWDQGRWDQAVWAGEGSTYEAWVGASGVGRYGSLALQVRGAADTIFIGWQAVVEPGGIL
jgi:hypothetical protein